jgi:DNA-binding PadR family transcriptional regulator
MDASMLKYALLGFLSYTSYSGYDLAQQISASTGFFWHAKLSQIYTTLKKLESDGLVVSHIESQDERPDRRVYTITESGQTALQIWLEKPLTKIETVKNSLLLKLFFSARVDTDTVLTQLRLQRELYAQELELYRQKTRKEIQETAAQHPELERDALFWEMTLRYGEAYNRMIIDWLNESIEKLEKK